METYLQKTLPLMVRVSAFMEANPKCPDSLRTVLEPAQKDFVEGYTPSGNTILGTFQTGVEKYLEGKLGKPWYITYSVQALVSRRGKESMWSSGEDEAKEVTESFKGFLKHHDTLMKTLDILKAPEVPAYKEQEPDKTVDDLKNPLSVDVYNMLEKAMSNMCVQDPNGAFGFALTMSNLIEDEDSFYEDGEFTGISTGTMSLVKQVLGKGDTSHLETLGKISELSFEEDEGSE